MLEGLEYRLQFSFSFLRFHLFLLAENQLNYFSCFRWWINYTVIAWNFVAFWLPSKTRAKITKITAPP